MWKSYLIISYQIGANGVTKKASGVANPVTKNHPIQIKESYL